MAAISIKQLLEAGVHFGHQTGRWNPKMKPYIFGQRNGVHIIDLQKTLRLFKEAVNFVTNLAAQGKTVLFVGTKSQAQETIEEEACRCGMYFVNNRWLGGLLTNFSTVQNSIKRYQELESMRDNGFYEKLSKKEVARLERERKRLEKNLRGIKEMNRCPDALFVVDSNQEDIAVKEASKLKIPIIAVVDTNSDPDLIDYVIPGNDDALRAVKLFAQTIADAILAGKAIYEARVEAETKEARERAAKEAAQREAAREAKEAAKRAVEVKAEATSAVPAEEKIAAEEEKEAEVGEKSVALEAAESVDSGEEEKEEEPAPVQEMKKEKEEEKKARKPRRKAQAKKSKGETKKTKAAKGAKKEKSKAKSQKTATKKKKSTPPKTKTSKRQAKSEGSKKSASKKSSAGAGASPEPEKDAAKVKAKS